MTPEIRFLPDRHGRTIAHASSGRGEPLVCDTGWVTHIEAFWAYPPYRRFFEALGHNHRVIRFDRPGMGLGQPGARVVGLEADVAVLEDLVDGLGLRRFDLFGASQAAATMIAYAARHPERVTRLIVFGGYADGTRLARPEVRDSLLQLVRAHWGIAADTFADIFVAGGDQAAHEAFARLTTVAASAEVAVERLADNYRTDVRDLLPLVQAPALVMHRRGDRSIRFELGHEIAAGIKGARFVPLEGESHIFYVGDVDSVLKPVLDFLGDRRRPPRPELGELTHREQEVSALVAQGLTNGEIAARLRISERTAEAHLEHVRNKLGFRSRAQIAAWVADNLASEIS